MCSSRKYSYPPQGRFTEIARGEAKIYKGQNEARLEFPGDWEGGFQTKRHTVGRAWIFSGTVHKTTKEVAKPRK